MGNSNESAIIGRVLIKGILELKSPLLIGDGQQDTDGKDIVVVCNGKGQPMIPGTSLCGVLREYAEGMGCAELLFGNAGDKGHQSLISLEDVFLQNTSITVRDGIKIDSYTGVTIEGGKYDYEVVERGAYGEFEMTAIIRKEQEAKIDSIRQHIIQLRERMKAGISVGAATAKGLGQVELKEVKSGFYHFDNPKDVKAWLADSSRNPEMASDNMEDVDDLAVDLPEDCVIEGDFSLASSLLVRDVENISEYQKSKGVMAAAKKSGEDYVIPGSSLKGVLRHRAEYILDELNIDDELGALFLEELMGMSDKTTKVKSRFVTYECYISSGVKEYFQPRIRIDRFTGGTVRSALFKEAAIWQQEKGEKIVNIKFTIKNASEAEVGLSLLLLRDLSIGRVALGSGKSIGRGTLKGQSAVLKYNGHTYNINSTEKLDSGEKELLEGYIESLILELGGEC